MSPELATVYALLAVIAGLWSWVIVDVRRQK